MARQTLKGKFLFPILMFSSFQVLMFPSYILNRNGNIKVTLPYTEKTDFSFSKKTNIFELASDTDRSDRKPEKV